VARAGPVYRLIGRTGSFVMDPDKTMARKQALSYAALGVQRVASAWRFTRRRSASRHIGQATSDGRQSSSGVSVGRAFDPDNRSPHNNLRLQNPPPLLSSVENGALPGFSKTVFGAVLLSGSRFLSSTCRLGITAKIRIGFTVLLTLLIGSSSGGRSGRLLRPPFSRFVKRCR
jgi:hypothetical protein